MADLYLGLGSNLGDREALLRRAVKILAERIGPQVALSAFYATKPWGFSSNHPFLNAVLVLRTELTPEETLRTTQQVERELGRMQKSTDGGYADRTIDIDLLLYGNMVCEADFDWPEGRVHLSLPHPLLHVRRFVLEPLAEVAPGVEHPVLKRTISELLDELSNSCSE